MFALIQWLDGQSKNTHSVVPSSWIRDFNLKLLKKKESEVFVVELRYEGKIPVEGWPLYNVKVIDAHGNRKKLETRARELDSNKNYIQDCTSFMDSPPDAEMSETVNAEYKFDGVNIKTEVDEFNALKSKLHYLEEENKKLMEENLTLLRRISDEIPELRKHLLSTRGDSQHQQFTEPLGRSNCPCLDLSLTFKKYVPRVLTGMVELYQGSGIFIESHVMQHAMRKTKPRAFIGTLLVGLFSINDLLKSNYKGGMPKRLGISGDRASDRKTALCPKSLDAIFKATLKKFPNVTKGQFGLAINTKIANLRHISKKRAEKSL